MTRDTLFKLVMLLNEIFKIFAGLELKMRSRIDLRIAWFWQKLLFLTQRFAFKSSPIFTRIEIVKSLIKS